MTIKIQNNTTESVVMFDDGNPMYIIKDITNVE